MEEVKDASIIYTGDYNNDKDITSQDRSLYFTKQIDKSISQDTPTDGVQLSPQDISKFKEAIEKEVLEYKIKNIWGEEAKGNIVLLKRAIAWLQQGCENLEDSFVLLNKLVTLGKILSEEIMTLNSTDSGEIKNKEEAVKQRLELTNNKDNIKILNNKAHLQHRSLLERLEKLNAIIAGNE